MTEKAGIVRREAALLGKSRSNDGLNLGPGACFLDYDRDGQLDIFVTKNGPAGVSALYHNIGDGKFEDVTKKAGLDPNVHGIGCTAGITTTMVPPDLVVSLSRTRVMLFHNEKNGTFKDVTEDRWNA